MWVFDFYPVADAEPIEYVVNGDVLTVNGETYDFGPLPEGAVVPKDAVSNNGWLKSNVCRWQGSLRLCVVMPFPSNLDLPTHVRHPDAYAVVGNGRVSLPTDEVQND